MTRRELIDLCLSYPDSYEDYPFDDLTAGAGIWTVMRHLSNKKSFAMIYERGGLCVNLKCEPARADLLRQLFDGIQPGYHMNKEHWNTVYVNQDVPEDVLREMLDRSFGLTAPKTRKKHPDEWTQEGSEP